MKAKPTLIAKAIANFNRIRLDSMLNLVSASQGTAGTFVGEDDIERLIDGVNGETECICFETEKSMTGDSDEFVFPLSNLLGGTLCANNLLSAEDVFGENRTLMFHQEVTMDLAGHKK